MSSCEYRIGGECALLSKDFDLNTIEERLMHIANCQEEIIKNQSEVIYELFSIVGQRASATSEEMEDIIKKINEAALIRAEV